MPHATGVEHNAFGHHLVFSELDLFGRQIMTSSVNPEVSRLPPVEAVLRELVTHPLHLGAFLRRTEVGLLVDLSHGPPPSATFSLHMMLPSSSPLPNLPLPSCQEIN
ncbi:hypothetical protein HU200_039899 [Digitaria exilis]|uniref:Uncharacterized protein n=1 Tax=Digitaria exilis TaxID=1010633 RepID=A0A835BAG5_9POAL|nr:hypothetical protein HU200_039899 [Digitaria exilis]